MTSSNFASQAWNIAKIPVGIGAGMAGAYGIAQSSKSKNQTPMAAASLNQQYNPNNTNPTAGEVISDIGKGATIGASKLGEGIASGLKRLENNPSNYKHPNAYSLNPYNPYINPHVAPPYNPYMCNPYMTMYPYGCPPMMY